MHVSDLFECGGSGCIQRALDRFVSNAGFTEDGAPKRIGLGYFQRSMRPLAQRRLSTWTAVVFGVKSRHDVSTV